MPLEKEVGRPQNISSKMLDYFSSVQYDKNKNNNKTTVCKGKYLYSLFLFPFLTDCNVEKTHTLTHAPTHMCLEIVRQE